MTYAGKHMSWQRSCNYTEQKDPKLPNYGEIRVLFRLYKILERDITDRQTQLIFLWILIR